MKLDIQCSQMNPLEDDLIRPVTSLEIQNCSILHQSQNSSILSADIMLKIYSYLTVKDLMTKVEVLSRFDRNLIANQSIIYRERYIQLPFESQNKSKKFNKQIKILSTVAKYTENLKLFIDDGDYFSGD